MQVPSAENVPQELWYLIFEYITPKDACIASTVCSGWHDFLRDQQLWKIWHQSELADSPRYIFEPHQWRESYQAIIQHIYKKPRNSMGIIPSRECEYLSSHENGLAMMFARAIECGASVLVDAILDQLNFSKNQQMIWLNSAVLPGEILLYVSGQLIDLIVVVAGNDKVLQLLLDAFRPDLSQQKLLEAACRLKTAKLPTIKLLLAHGAEVTDSELRAVIAANDLPVPTFPSTLSAESRHNNRLIIAVNDLLLRARR